MRGEPAIQDWEFQTTAAADFGCVGEWELIAPGPTGGPLRRPRTDTGRAVERPWGRGVVP